MSANESMESILTKAISDLRSVDLTISSADSVRKHDARHGEIINKAPLGALEAVRERLDPTNDFVAYVAVLHASLAMSKPSDVHTPILISAYCRFALELGSEYACVLPHRWCGAGRHAARLAIEGHSIQQCLSLVVPLREAAVKIAPSDDHLVPLHADFLAICIEAKCYDVAGRWASHRRLQVDANATAIDASDVLLTYYYSGCVYIGLKDFRRALDYFRIALAVPVQQSGRLNDLILATYKKYVLMSVLVQGKTPGPLKFCTYNTNRLRCGATEYLEFGNAFTKRRLNELQDIEEVNKVTFEKDGNLGLVKQIVRFLPCEIIRGLTCTFVAMRIEDVAVRAGIDSKQNAEKLLVDMISDGSIRGHIDSKDDVVRFVDKVDDGSEEGREVYETPEALSSMNEKMQRCLKSLRHIQLFRDSILKDSQYLKKEQQAQRQKSHPRDPLGFVTSEDAEMDTRDLEADVDVVI